MYGLDIGGVETALFVTNGRAYKAKRRLQHLMQRTGYCDTNPVYERGELKGYNVLLRGPEGTHEITETDVVVLGL